MEPTEAKTDSAPRRRRWFQYSLRALLVAMLLASIGMSWVAVRRQRARRQKGAVEMILGMGGDFSAVMGTGPKAPDDRNSRMRESAAEVAGWTYHRAVEANEFAPGTISAEDLEQYRQRWIDTKTEIVGSGKPSTSLPRWLAPDEFLPRVTHVFLSKKPVGDDLRFLSVLDSMEFLDLSDTDLSDRGLADVARLKCLRYLHLERTRVTDVGVKKLQQALPNCEIIR